MVFRLSAEMVKIGRNFDFDFHRYINLEILSQKDWEINSKICVHTNLNSIAGLYVEHIIWAVISIPLIITYQSK